MAEKTNLVFTVSQDQNELVASFGPFLPIQVNGTLQNMLTVIADAESAVATAITAADAANDASAQASTSASNAATSASGAATSASTATSQATNAATSATAAATSATNAATSATSSSNSASASGASAAGAAASATAAATSATNAAASATSATNTYNSFANGTGISAGSLDGTEIFPVTRGNGLLQATAQSLGLLALSSLAPQRQTIVATSANQASYPTTGYSTGLINVYMAGIRLSPSQYTATDGTTVVITDSSILSQIIVGTAIDIEATQALPSGQLATASALNNVNTTLGTQISTVSNSLNALYSQVSYLAGRNRIINGGINVNQRPYNNAAAVTGTTAAYGGADRWVCTNGGAGGTINQSIGTIVYNGVTYNSIKQTATAVLNDLSSTKYWSGIAQGIEQVNCYDLVGKQVTVSFVFQASQVGNYSVSLRTTPQGPNTWSLNRSFTYTASGVPQYVTMTFPIIPAAAAFGGGTALGMYLMIGAQNNGTYLTTSQGTWQNGNYVTCSGNVAWGLTANAYISATMIQLEADVVATPFERKPYSEVLAQCQRYCYVINGNTAIVGTGTVVSTTIMDCSVSFPVSMRTNAPALYTSNRRCCKKRSLQGVTFTRNGRGAASVNSRRNCVDSRYLAGRCARTNARAASLKAYIESGTGRSTTQG